MPGYNEMCELEWCEEIKIVIFMARVNRSHLRAAKTVIIHASLISDSSIFVLAVIVTLSSQGPSFCSSQDPDVARTIIMIIIIITITNTIT